MGTVLHSVITGSEQDKPFTTEESDPIKAADMLLMRMCFEMKQPPESGRLTWTHQLPWRAAPRLTSTRPIPLGKVFSANLVKSAVAIPRPQSAHTTR